MKVKDVIAQCGVGPQIKDFSLEAIQTISLQGSNPLIEHLVKEFNIFIRLSVPDHQYEFNNKYFSEKFIYIYIFR